MGHGEKWINRNELFLLKNKREISQWSKDGKNVFHQCALFSTYTQATAKLLDLINIIRHSSDIIMCSINNGLYNFKI